jgi:RNA polymerase sigma factor (sigma-70 family)
MPGGSQCVLGAPNRELNSAASVFMAHRPKIFGIAYRMLHNVADAEDLVQDVWLRWQNCNRDVVREPAAFLAVTTTRLAINALQSARARHETSIGDWPQDQPSALAEPGLEAERADALARAVQLMLVKLSPAERAAFILREAFDYPYERVAAIVFVSEASARQLVSRARKRLSSDREAAIHTLEHRRLFSAIVAAAGTGNMGVLEQLLVPQGSHVDARIVA